MLTPAFFHVPKTKRAAGGAFSAERSSRSKSCRRLSPYRREGMIFLPRAVRVYFATAPVNGGVVAGSSARQARHALAHLVGRNVLDVRRQGPKMPERILEHAAAIAVELVPERPLDLGAGFDRPLDARVDV